MANADVSAVVCTKGRIMNVVHISTSDIEGGSARSAWRIHENVAALGVQSRMLVGFKSSESTDVDEIPGSKLMMNTNHLVNRIELKLGLQYCYLPSQHRLNKHAWIGDASIIQLYNLHGGYFNLTSLMHFPKQAKIIWRLSDLWPLTGHCAYPGACERWAQGCGECPDLETYPSIGLDSTAFLWLRKQKIYNSIKPFTVVAPSSWTERVAKESPMLEGCDIRRIPNGINTDIFRPKDRSTARAALGIRDARPAILFCAHVAFDNPRKGTDFLRKVLNSLPESDEYFFIVAGRNSEKWVGETQMRTYPIGFVEDDETLSNLYAASDVVIIPSLVENLPNTAIEALSCERPVIALDAGGMTDVVRDNITGFCLPVGDLNGVVTRLKLLLNNSELRGDMGRNGRFLIKKDFDENVEACRFVDLYEELQMSRLE